MDKNTDAATMGRPRKYNPQFFTMVPSEDQLARMAFNLAKREGISFEKAFTKISDTPEGKFLIGSILP